jgi:hypothetical protein
MNQDIIKKYQDVIDGIDSREKDLKENHDVPQALVHATEQLVWAQVKAITDLVKAICYEKIGALDVKQ